MATASPAPAEHPVFARLWMTAMRHCEPRAITQQRERLVAGLTGTVVEIGCGSGSMFRHYRAGVERVIAVEPEPSLFAEAQRVAAEAPVPIEVHRAAAEALPLGDGEADAAVCSLVLCSVPDQAVALAELQRVLRPGGELRYYEHVAEPAGTPSRRVQDWLDRSGLWPRMGGGCHCSRDTSSAIRAAGFEVESEYVETFGLPLVVPVRRHLAGVARV